MENGYKKAVHDLGASGRGRSNFEFYEEMDSLLGDWHALRPPVTASSKGVTIHKPNALKFKPTEEEEY